MHHSLLSIIEYVYIFTSISAGPYRGTLDIRHVWRKRYNVEEVMENGALACATVMHPSVGQYTVTIIIIIIV